MKKKKKLCFACYGVGEYPSPQIKDQNPSRTKVFGIMQFIKRVHPIFLPFYVLPSYFGYVFPMYFCLVSKLSISFHHEKYYFSNHNLIEIVFSYFISIVPNPIQNHFFKKY